MIDNNRVPLLSRDMRAAAWTILLVVGCVLGAGMPSAGAEIVPMAPHEKSFQSDAGNFTVGTRDETINRIPPLNQVGMTREALVTETSYATVSTPGVLLTGYHVGCAMELSDIMFGAWTLPFVGNIPGAPVQPSGLLEPAPIVTMDLMPGQVWDVPMAEKQLVPGKPATSTVRDFHIVVNHCTGPVSIREYAYVYVGTEDSDDSGAVFGDSTWL